MERRGSCMYWEILTRHPPHLTMLSWQPRKLQELIWTIKIHNSRLHLEYNLEGFSKNPLLKVSPRPDSPHKKKKNTTVTQWILTGSEQNK